MKYRKLGKTGISVSEIGFGTWGIGGITEGATSYGKTDDAESLRTLKSALEEGINFYDTSNIYGNGHAEELLAEAFRADRKKIVIATKVGFTKHSGPHDISAGYIRECLEGSLQRLKTDYVDLYQIHSIPIETAMGSSDWLPTLKVLKKEGKIRAIGYSVRNPEDSLIVMRELGVDVIQVNFNMTDQRALNLGVFEVARDQGVGIIARTPLSFGFLTGTITDIGFDPEDHRSNWSKEQLIKWKEAPDLFSFVDLEKRYTPVQLALKFCLGFPEISTTIPGMTKVEQAKENAAASDLPPLEPEQIKAIMKVNRENIFFIPKE